jgi:hypothetical protein
MWEVAYSLEEHGIAMLFTGSDGVRVAPGVDEE